ncbi:MAG TPA: hypothetical protein VF719_07205 [Abditibacteriaceae bacterium]|jgi:hypothetical protein
MTDSIEIFWNSEDDDGETLFCATCGEPMKEFHTLLCFGCLDKVKRLTEQGMTVERIASGWQPMIQVINTALNGEEFMRAGNTVHSTRNENE